MKTTRSGFTLLELMIGLVIVTILATIALPNFSKAIEKTKVKDAQTTLSAISTAEKIYRLDQGAYGNLGSNGNPDDLIRLNYISDPDPTNNNANWDFTATPAGGGTTFTATATRTGGSYNGNRIVINQNFNGTNYDPAGTLGSTHPLRDQ